MKRALGTWAIAIAMLAGAANAGRPLIIDDAAPVDAGKFELELGVFYSDSWYGTHCNTPIGLTCGLPHQLEVGVGFGWHFDRQIDSLLPDRSETGFADVVLGGKWKFLEQQHAWFDHALAVSVKFPTASRDRGLGSGKADYDVTWILTHQFGSVLAMDLNVGYTWIGTAGDDPNGDILHYGLALRYALNDRLEPVVEIAASKLMHEADAAATLLNAGLRWKALDNLTFDVAAGVGITGDSPHWTVTAGLTWAF